MKFRENFNRYEVYPELGRIVSLWGKTEHWLSTNPDKRGYVKIRLYDDNGTPHHFKAHNVMYETYYGHPIPEDGVVHHKNLIANDNRIDNLVLMRIEDHILYHQLVGKAANAAKPIGQYDMDGNLIKVWDSLHQVNRELGYSRGSVRKNLNGISKSSYNCIWKYMEN